jgi:type III pantothenate kinase
MIKETHDVNKSAAISSIVASVVPDSNALINGALACFCKRRPLYVKAGKAGMNSGLVFSVKEPFRMGSDRIANAIAGVSCNKGRPTAIVDFGTATTVTVIGRQRTVMGGAILPGVYLMTKALHAGTAKLPLASLDALQNAIGKDTASSITSGVAYGTAGAVEKLIKMMEKELKYKLQLVLTGGDAPFISPYISRSSKLRPNLTFEGLRLIYLENIKTK